MKNGVSISYARNEVLQLMDDLRAADVDFLTARLEAARAARA